MADSSLDTTHRGRGRALGRVGVHVECRGHGREPIFILTRRAGTMRLDATRQLPISALNEPILLEPAFEGLRIEYDLCMAAKPGPDESEGYRLRDDIRGPTNATDRPCVSCIAKLKPCPMRTSINSL